MKWSFASAGMIMFGLFGLALIILMQNITTKNEEDYYLLKEISKASMLEAVDEFYMKDTGELKINKEKFIENFIRRFSTVAQFNKEGYKVEFYDIIETPPKASIRVLTKNNMLVVGGNVAAFDILNQIDVILETYDRK